MYGFGLSFAILMFNEIEFICAIVCTFVSKNKEPSNADKLHNII